MPKLSDKKELEEIYLKCGFALKMLETELEILIKEYAYEKKYDPVEHTKSRLKTKESVIKKLVAKGYEVNNYNLLNHIHDLIGVRIVCSFLSDVYDIVALIKNSNKYVIKEEKDYIKNPKETGYISYHIIVTLPIYLDEQITYIDAEIQVRTIAMDFWASLDHKIQYKFPSVIPSEVKKEMYNCSIDIKQLDDKMNELNNIVNKYKNE